MTDTFLYTSPTAEISRPLVEQLTAEYHNRYGAYFGEPASAEMNRYPPERFAPPDGAFVLLLRDGTPIAGGAFMRYDETTAEFKRVWTDADHRRQGLAQRVLVELENRAVALGYSRVYLTTGFRQPEARELYLKTGYTALFDLAADPEAIQILAFEKALPPKDRYESPRNDQLAASLA